MAAPGRFWARFQGLRRAEGPAEPAAGAATTGTPAEVCRLAAAGGGTPGATAGAPDGGGSRGEAPSEEGPRHPPPEEGAGAPPEGPRDAGGFRHSGSVESQSLLSSYCSDYSDSKSSPRAGRRNSRGSSDAEVQLADDVHRFLEFAPVGKRRRGRRRVANQSRIRRGNSTLADALFDVPEDDEAVGKITMSTDVSHQTATVPAPPLCDRIWSWLVYDDRDDWKWLDDLPSEQELGRVPADIFRGLPVGRMLGQGPSLMENSRTNCTYELSEPVEPSEKLDVFMSHTWTSDRFLKYVAILYHFNGHFSHVAAHFAALATFLVLLTVKVFTPWGVYMPVFHLPFPGNPTEYPEGMPLCGPVFFVGCVTQITTFAFGHVLFKTRSVYQQMIFLDKCCIHQTDPELKRRGIDYMGNFVTQSKTMFIPFDNDYFERLWCNYELAAFLRHKKSEVVDSLNFMPIQVAVFVTIHIVLCFVGITGFLVMLAINDFIYKFWYPQSWLEYFAIWGTGGTLIFGVPKFVFCHISMQGRQILDQKLASFTTRDAKVGFAADRQPIEERIQCWFGTIEAFDQLVQKIFPEIVTRSIGTPRQSLRYADLLQENAGVLFLFVYDAVLMALGDPRKIMRCLVIGLSEHFILDPIYFYSLNALAFAALKLPYGNTTNHGIRGASVFLLGLVYPVYFSFCICCPVWLLIVSAVVLGIVGAIIPYFFER